MPGSAVRVFFLRPGRLNDRNFELLFVGVCINGREALLLLDALGDHRRILAQLELILGILQVFDARAGWHVWDYDFLQRGRRMIMMVVVMMRHEAGRLVLVVEDDGARLAIFGPRRGLDRVVDVAAELLPAVGNKPILDDRVVRRKLDVVCLVHAQLADDCRRMLYLRLNVFPGDLSWALLVRFIVRDRCVHVALKNWLQLLDVQETERRGG